MRERKSSLGDFLRGEDVHSIHHVLLIMDRSSPPRDDNTLTLQHSSTEPGV